MPRLEKVKRPGGTFVFDLLDLGQDDDGVWLLGPAGTRWTAPHDQGELPVDVLVLLAANRPWVTWWVDAPGDRRVEIDVCLPPEPTGEPGGWSYVDLELDPIRHQDGAVEVEDHDELEVALGEGWMTEVDGELATATAEHMAQVLRDHDEPWGVRGWQRLAAALATHRSGERPDRR